MKKKIRKPEHNNEFPPLIDGFLPFLQTQPIPSFSLELARSLKPVRQFSFGLYERVRPYFSLALIELLSEHNSTNWG
jgi:hypothetical protein